MLLTQKVCVRFQGDSPLTEFTYARYLQSRAHAICLAVRRESTICDHSYVPSRVSHHVDMRFCFCESKFGKIDTNVNLRWLLVLLV